MADIGYKFIAGDELSSEKLNLALRAGLPTAGETITGGTLPTPVYHDDAETYDYKYLFVATDGGNSYSVDSSSEKVMQSFTMTCSNLKSISLSLRRVYSGTFTTNLTLGIYAIDGNGKPTGSAIVTATRNTYTPPYSYNEFTRFDFADTTLLTKNTQYVMVLSTSTNDSFYWYYGSNTYAGGGRGYSTDGGSTWTTDTADMAFILIGYDFTASTGKIYKSDADVYTKKRFDGFAISTANANNPIKVQYDGIVNGFTNLKKGKPYYLQDTAGTIGTTKGTYATLVGQAINDSELKIIREEVPSEDRWIEQILDSSMEEMNDIYCWDYCFSSDYLHLYIVYSYYSSNTTVYLLHFSLDQHTGKYMEISHTSVAGGQSVDSRVGITTDGTYIYIMHGQNGRYLNRHGIAANGDISGTDAMTISGGNAAAYGPIEYIDGKILIGDGGNNYLEVYTLSGTTITYSTKFIYTPLSQSGNNICKGMRIVGEQLYTFIYKTYLGENLTALNSTGKLHSIPSGQDFASSYQTLAFFTPFKDEYIFVNLRYDKNSNYSYHTNELNMVKISS